jgi:hypothetical protein
MWFQESYYGIFLPAFVQRVSTMNFIIFFFFPISSLTGPLFPNPTLINRTVDFVLVFISLAEKKNLSFNSILHTLRLDGHTLTLNNYTAKYYEVKTIWFLA